MPAQTAKVCGLLPIPQLEAASGSSASAPKGNDAPSISICGVTFGDVRQTAAITRMPPSPTDKSLGVEQRLALLQRADGAEKQKFESRSFGDTGCFRIEQDMGDKPLPSITCFADRGLPGTGPRQRRPQGRELRGGARSAPGGGRAA
jgi:hypothetical protein